MTKAQLESKTNKLIAEAVKGIRKNMKKAIKSGSMDIKGAEDNYILPRALLIALLKEETRQFSAGGSCFERQIAKESANIYRCI
jgi:hypothetical protein